MKKQFDIVIVGGGMVGLAMAAALAKNDITIALIEKNSFDDLKNTNWLSSITPIDEEYALRVSAISPGNQQFLKEINCWQNIPAARLADYEKMFVWDGHGSGEIQFDAAESGQKILGSIVENQVLRAAILARLESFTNISYFTEVAINSINEINDRVDVSLTNKQKQLASQPNTSAVNQTISAKLLIAADGAFSSVREKLAIQNHSSDYHQTAFVTTVRTEQPHQNTAWQRFDHFGPIAFLPLTDPHLCSIVWSVDNSRAENLAHLSPTEFINELSGVFENKLGQLTPVREFQGFPLIKRHAECYLKNRCVLIGDAAHTIHPLAGLGVNLGFQDVNNLNQLINKLLSNKRDIGLLANLRPFERQRKAENRLTQETMSGFKWLFGHQSMPTTLLRNWGLTLVNNSDWLKQLIIQKALN